MQTRNARVFEARDLSGAIVGVLHLLDSGECVIHGKIPSGAMLTEALAESNQSRFGWEVERMPSGMRRLTVQDGHAFASIVLTEQSAEQLRDAL